MSSKLGDIKGIFFRIKAWQILLIVLVIGISAAWLVLNFLYSELSIGPNYILLAILLAIIAINGNSILNRNGIDASFLLFFGFMMVFGGWAGVAVIVITTPIAFYLARTHTPIDFFLEKNMMILFIHMTNLLCAVALFWAIKSFFGMSYIHANLVIVYMAIFLISRGVRMAMLVMFAQLPAIKVGITNLICAIVNWYLITLIGLAYFNFLASV